MSEQLREYGFNTLRANQLFAKLKDEGKSDEYARTQARIVDIEEEQIGKTEFTECELPDCVMGLPPKAYECFENYRTDDGVSALFFKLCTMKVDQQKAKAAAMYTHKVACEKEKREKKRTLKDQPEPEPKPKSKTVRQVEHRIVAAEQKRNVSLKAEDTEKQDSPLQPEAKFGNTEFATPNLLKRTPTPSEKSLPAKFSTQPESSALSSDRKTEQELLQLQLGAAHCSGCKKKCTECRGFHYPEQHGTRTLSMHGVPKTAIEEKDFTELRKRLQHPNLPQVEALQVDKSSGMVYVVYAHIALAETAMTFLNRTNRIWRADLNFCETSNDYEDTEWTDDKLTDYLDNNPKVAEYFYKRLTFNF